MPVVAAVGAIAAAVSTAAAAVGTAVVGALGLTVASSTTLAVIGGAVVGAVSGGVIAAVKGENILEGALKGGLIGGTVAFGATSLATSSTASGGISGSMGAGSDAASLAAAEAGTTGGAVGGGVDAVGIYGNFAEDAGAGLAKGVVESGVKKETEKGLLDTLLATKDGKAVLLEKGMDMLAGNMEGRAEEKIAKANREAERAKEERMRPKYQPGIKENPMSGKISGLIVKKPNETVAKVGTLAAIEGAPSLTPTIQGAVAVPKDGLLDERNRINATA